MNIKLKEKTRIIDKVFWSAYNRYWETLDQSGAIKQRVEDAVGRLVEHGATPPQQVLDAGCGSGVYSLALAQAGFEATGVDYAPGVLTGARRKADGLQLSAQFEKMDLDGSLWYADGDFDHAICIAALHVVGRPEWTLSELHRVIKPGGLLLVTLWLDPIKYREAYPEVFAASGPGNAKKSQAVLNRAVETARKLSERTNRALYWTAEEFRTLLTAQGFEVLYLDGSPLLTAVAKRS